MSVDVGLVASTQTVDDPALLLLETISKRL